VSVPAVMLFAAGFPSEALAWWERHTRDKEVVIT
jgi:hypothetical protein